MAEPTPLPSDPIAEAHRHWQEHGWADAADGIRITVADGEQVEVTIADGPDSLDHVPVVGPMIVRLRIDPATGRVEVTQSAWSPAEIP